MFMINKNKFFLIIFFACTYLLIFSFFIEAIGVRPLVINLDMQPGETKNIQLKITPEKIQKRLTFNLYQINQKLNGSLSYQIGDIKRNPAIGWVDIQDEIVIPPGEKKLIEGTIDVPYDASGSHTIVIMVEPVLENPENGIAFKVRYAIRVNINIRRPGVREKVEVNNLQMISNERNKPEILTLVENTSNLLYQASAEVTIRDQNRRLVQRVPIKSTHAYNAGREGTKIYPGAKVRFYGEVTEFIHPGTYNLRLFLYYADGKQKIVSKQIEVGDEFTKEGQIDHIELTPTFIEESIRAGGATTKVLQIRNRTGKQLQIKVGGQEIKPKYEHSLFQNFEVQMRGQNNFTLEPRRTGRSIVILRSPREIKPGGYYGKVQIGVFDQEGNQLETKTVDMGMLVGEEREYDCNIKGITSHKDQEQQIFSVSLQNIGSAHFAPNARVYLKDDQGEIIHTLRLALPEGKSGILPDMTGHLFTTRNDIKPGNYTAEITVMHEGEEITTAEYPILIAGEKGDKSA